MGAFVENVKKNPKSTHPTVQVCISVNTIEKLLELAL
jgi:hypothetical protein